MPHTNGFYTNRHFTLSVDMFEQLLGLFHDLDHAIEHGDLPAAVELMRAARPTIQLLRQSVYANDPGARSSN